jgi:hypothetical protein
MYEDAEAIFLCQGFDRFDIRHGLDKIDMNWTNGQNWTNCKGSRPFVRLVRLEARI